MPLLPSAPQNPSVRTESLRPQFHFTAVKGWINDPNGLSYYKGEYHLFYQWDPDGVEGRHKAWGHAVSKDLIHWRDLPPAIMPDAMGDIWSGSAVADLANTSGLGTPGRPPLLCFFTAAGGTNDESKGKLFTQCVSYSLDGVHFQRISSNPVIGNITEGDRDPKVVRDEARKQWVLALYLDGDRFALFTSKDLLHWTKSSELHLPNAGECPDFFPLDVDGKKDAEKWVFWSAPGIYEVGQFDGQTFHPEYGPFHSYYGNTGYAPQTFFNDPKGRRVQITWLNGSDFPGQAWSQQLSIPCELKLKSTVDGPRLTFNPVHEVDGLRAEKLRPESSGDGKTFDSPNGLFDFQAKFDATNGGGFKVTVHGIDLTYDSETGLLQAEGRSIKLSPSKSVIDVRVIVDRGSVEVFADGGLVQMPFYKSLPAGPDSLKATVSGETKLVEATAYSMKSAW